MDIKSLIEEFSSVTGVDENDLLANQVDIMEKHLNELDYKQLVHEGMGIWNCFYYKESEDVVFVSYFSRNTKKAAYCTMDYKVFDQYFKNTDARICLSIRNDKQYSIVLSIGGEKIILAHFNDNYVEGSESDHIFHCIWLNDSYSTRPCTSSENNRNKCNARGSSNGEFSYKPEEDFRERWWLIACATVLHVISIEEAKQINLAMQLEA